MCVVKEKMRKRGFTLIELIIVIGIIALLVMITIGFAARTVRKKARDAVRKTNVRGYINGLDLYNDAKMRFPTKGDDYTKEDGTTDVLGDTSTAKDAVGAMVNTQAVSVYPTEPLPDEPLYYWSSNNRDDSLVSPLLGNTFMEAGSPALSAGFCQDMEAGSSQFCLYVNTKDG